MSPFCAGDGFQRDSESLPVVNTGYRSVVACRYSENWLIIITDKLHISTGLRYRKEHARATGHGYTGQRIIEPCKATESSRFGWSCVSTSDSRSSGARAASPSAPVPPSIQGRWRSTRTVRKSSRPEYSRSGCCRRRRPQDDRPSRLSLMAILSSRPLGTANHQVAMRFMVCHSPLDMTFTARYGPVLPSSGAS